MQFPRPDHISEAMDRAVANGIFITGNQPCIICGHPETTQLGKWFCSDLPYCYYCAHWMGWLDRYQKVEKGQLPHRNCIVFGTRYYHFFEPPQYVHDAIGFKYSVIENKAEYDRRKMQSQKGYLGKQHKIQILQTGEIFDTDNLWSAELTISYLHHIHAPDWAVRPDTALFLEGGPSW
jgi:hypothetical protein